MRIARAIVDACMVKFAIGEYTPPRVFPPDLLAYEVALALDQRAAEQQAEWQAERAALRAHARQMKVERDEARAVLSSRVPQSGGEGRLEQKIALLKKNWLKVAEQALAGDLGPLRTRVDLAKTTEWELEQQAASPCPDALRKALEPFAEAATTFEREYGHLMKPDTGCNIKFSALVAAREALAASPTPADAPKGDVRAALEEMRAYASANAQAAATPTVARVWRAFERKCVAALSALQAEATAAIRSQP